MNDDRAIFAEWLRGWTKARLGKPIVYRTALSAASEILPRLSRSSADIGAAFQVGDKVEKVTGDYAFPGTVVAVIRKLSGQVRFAVEDDRGAIHIFNETQLAEPDHA